MIDGKMIGVFALPSEMALSAYKRNRPVSEEAVSVSPVMTVYARSIADDAAAIVSVVDVLPKFLPPIRV